MKDRTLVMIALGTSFLGIGVLTMLLFTLDPPTSSDLSTEQDGAAIQLEGTVKQVSHRGNITVLTVEHTIHSQIVLFETIEVPENVCIKAIGKKGTYNNAPQLVARKIVRC